ncbi:hypothetical protein [Brevibacterium oceani]|uniref:hypothetical protein n=1 Tax=Brevibacterium oceani TaxID=358099 RepID=UPI0015E76372|nr:hypothetical protein [Brevibacterium oceani]
MGFKDKAVAFSRKLKLDSHHAIERFGVFFSLFTVVGAVVLAGSGAAAFTAGRDAMSERAMYTTQFETSKTGLGGDVDGIYVNENRNKALVLMHFDNDAPISYQADDYQAFLLGSNDDLSSAPLETAGITGQFHVFGSTGYIGMVLEAEEPFDQQVLNLTLRSNSELAFDADDEATGSDETAEATAGDPSFQQYDQWQVFFNPGASGVKEVNALDELSFDPARAYYDTVLKDAEEEARADLDNGLQAMRSDLARIESYTEDLNTTKADGLYLRPPEVPASIAGDEVVGDSAGEAEDGVSTLELKTEHVVPGGFDVNWRAGDVYEGYLDVLVPNGQTTSEYLAGKRDETLSDDERSDVSGIEWTLSDGSSLTEDYQDSDVTMRPLINVMNNLSQAYSDYSRDKTAYQSTLMLNLLTLDVDLRDVQSNSSVRDDEGVLTTLY